MIRLSSAGDVAMTIPVLHSLQSAYPQLRLTILTREQYADLFSELNATLVFAKTKSEHKGVFGIWRLWRQIKKMGKIDAVADLHNVVRSRIFGLIFQLSGVRVSIVDKQRKEKKELTRQENKILRPLKSNFIRYSQVFNKLGFYFDLSFRGLFQHAEVPLSVQQHTGVKSGKWVGIAPFAAFEWKEYPLNHLKKVLKHLNDSGGIKLIFFGGGERDEKVIEQLIIELPGAISLANKVSLADEMKTMKQLDLMIAMDSANMHFASLVNIPVVSIWGATHSFLGFSPWNQLETSQVQIPLFCRPCSVYGNVPCYRGDHACMNGLHPELIIEKVNFVLKR